MGVYDMKGKVALVTGGARGIGFEAARALQARGAEVAIVDLSADDANSAAERLDGRAIGLAADVSDLAAMQRAVADTVEQLGRIDIVVANAGIAPAPMTLAETGSEIIDRVIDVNLLGVYRTVQPALPQVIANGGHVVVVASVYAFVNGLLMASYAMSKAGVEQYGRALRAELSQHGASASVAYFGFIDTAMVSEGFGDPLGQRFEATFPRVLRRRLQPAAAGDAIARGIERRRPRIVAPGRWRFIASLRGILNPVLDRRAERNRTLRAVMRDIEASRR